MPVDDEEPQSCKEEPCLYGGTCTPNVGEDGFTCDCSPGRTGELCQLQINKCHSHPCQHGGHCLGILNGYHCVCGKTGYTGAHCETKGITKQGSEPCNSSPCSPNKFCMEDPSNRQGYVCTGMSPNCHSFVSSS